MKKLKIKKSSSLSELEKELLLKISDVHDGYCLLTNREEYHPSEMHEWVSAIHSLQLIIMSRVAVRSDPDMFVRPRRK